jgi:hypothetical protein
VFQYFVPFLSVLTNVRFSIAIALPFLECSVEVEHIIVNHDEIFIFCHPNTAFIRAKVHCLPDVVVIACRYCGFYQLHNLRPGVHRFSAPFLSGGSAAPPGDTSPGITLYHTRYKETTQRKRILYIYSAEFRKIGKKNKTPGGLPGAFVGYS